MTARAASCLFALAVLLASAPPAPALAEQSAATRPAPGKYAGSLVNEGKPNSAEWVRFTVNRRGTKATGFSVLANMYCYNAFTYSYDIYPTKIDVPSLQIKADGTSSRGWVEPYEVDGVPYQLTGAVELRFRPGRAHKVTGRLSVVFADCATTVGDAPYWTSLQAARS